MYSALVQILSKIEKMETIARGEAVDIRHILHKKYGRGNWNKDERDC